MDERLTALGLGVQSLAHVRCAAVGPSTADALRSMGLAVDVVPERYVGEALAHALADRVRGQRVLLVRAAAARDVVPEALAAAGARVTVVDAYRTVVPADTVARARAVFSDEPLPDAVVFTSGSTVRHLLDVLREAGLAFPREVACVSIGPVTSAALREAGLPVASEAETASLDGLVDACVRFFAA
jgi:uroporphyrinogen-III synthase